MAIWAWIDFGLISGSIAIVVVTKTGNATVMDIMLGVVGAIAGWHARPHGYYRHKS